MTLRVVYTAFIAKIPRLIFKSLTNKSKSVINGLNSGFKCLVPERRDSDKEVWLFLTELGD